MVADVVSSPTAAVAAVTSCTAAVEEVSSRTAAVVAVEGVTVLVSDCAPTAVSVKLEGKSATGEDRAVGRSPRDKRSPTDPSSSSTKSESPSVSIKQKLHQGSERTQP